MIQIQNLLRSFCSCTFIHICLFFLLFLCWLAKTISSCGAIQILTEFWNVCVKVWLLCTLVTIHHHTFCVTAGNAGLRTARHSPVHTLILNNSELISNTQEQINRLYQEQQQIQESATIFRWSTDDIATLSACKSTWETCLNCELPCLISDNGTCVFVSASVFESYVALYSAVVHRRVEAESQIVHTEEERQ